MSQLATSLLGALVADAASLGLHWLYDVGRIAEVVAREGKVAFIPPAQSNFDGAMAYFAHGAKNNGDLSHHGEMLRLTIQSIIKSEGGVFDAAAYQKDFSAHFGPGGAYHGYIDHAMRGTLAKIAAEQLEPSGVDDGQTAAIARLPAIVTMGGSAEAIQSVIEVTNVSRDATLYGAVVADLLRRTYAGEGVREALHACTEAAADGDIRSKLQDALTTSEQSSVKYGEQVGRACNLDMAVPLAFHILRDAPDYKTAIERNILAGGDSSGRATLIGAVASAGAGGKVGGAKGIPLEWVLSMTHGAEIWAECQALVGQRVCDSGEAVGS